MESFNSDEKDLQNLELVKIYLESRTGELLKRIVQRFKVKLPRSSCKKAEMSAYILNHLQKNALIEKFIEHEKNPPKSFGGGIKRGKSPPTMNYLIKFQDNYIPQRQSYHSN